jgi:hypothetical protein
MQDSTKACPENEHQVSLEMLSLPRGGRDSPASRTSDQSTLPSIGRIDVWPYRGAAGAETHVWINAITGALLGASIGHQASYLTPNIASTNAIQSAQECELQEIGATSHS